MRSVRLAGGSSPAEGLLEVQLGANSVGLVQTYSSNGDSGYSGEAALAVAAAVCRQLGLGGGALRGARLYFSASQLRGVLFALRCAARAASLAECGFMRPMPEYEGLDNSLAVACHGEAAPARCAGMPPPLPRATHAPPMSSAWPAAHPACLLYRAAACRLHHGAGGAPGERHDLPGGKS